MGLDNEWVMNDIRESTTVWIIWYLIYGMYLDNVLSSLNSKSSLFKTCLVKLFCGLSVHLSRLCGLKFAFDAMVLGWTKVCFSKRRLNARLVLQTNFFACLCGSVCLTSIRMGFKSLLFLTWMCVCACFRDFFSDIFQSSQ